MNLIVIGGGCYGCYHTRQLRKASRQGRIIYEHILVIDHNPTCRALTEFAGDGQIQVVCTDWLAYLCDHVRPDLIDPSDQLVPAPFAPHLLFDWLRLSLSDSFPLAQVQRRACTPNLALPYQHPDATGNFFISAAAWLCPATCIEPARCPAIKAPRTWELTDIVHQYVATHPDEFTGAVVFTCKHFSFGVGTIPLAQLLDARAHLGTLARETGEQRIAVATVSSCHGVVATLGISS